MARYKRAGAEARSLKDQGKIGAAGRMCRAYGAIACGCDPDPARHGGLG